MRAPRQLSVASFAALLLAGTLAAQGKVVPPTEKRARALVNQLELAERRAPAVEELLTLGAAGVSALAARLNDPRPDVVQIVCAVLCELGPTAAAALPQIVTAAGSPNAAIAYMVRLTEHRVRTTGATTFCEFGTRIVQIAADGTERVLHEGGNPWDFDVLPDGHLLVTHYADNKVVEYDATGKEVWSFTGMTTPLEADRLLDGHTLIGGSQDGRVIEVDPKGTIVWEWKGPDGHQAREVERLANDRTLVALYPDLVVEVDRAGKVVWKIEGLGDVFDADRLNNGNTLITQHNTGLVREVDPKGKTVWEASVAQACGAHRLPNGNTLVGTATSVLELGPDGKVVSENKRGKLVSEVARH